MGKLRLDLDRLIVDSFDTATPTKEEGTVFAEQCTCHTNCTCPGCPTCDASCGDSCNGTCFDHTCDHSCWGTCHDNTCWRTCEGQYTCETQTGNQIICMC
jgi:hypothetical protein